MKVNPLLLGATIILVTIAGAALLTYAVYVMTSNTVPVNVTAQETLSLTASPATVVTGNPVTLTATCTDATFDGLVIFTASGTNIGNVQATGGRCNIGMDSYNVWHIQRYRNSKPRLGA